MDHVALTIDGTVDSRSGEMRWMPPEKAAAFREAHSPDAELRRTVELAAHVRQALAKRPR